MKKQYRVLAHIVDYTIKARVKFENMGVYDCELEALSRIEFLIKNEPLMCHSGYSIIPFYEIFNE